MEGNKRFPVRIDVEGKPFKLFQEKGFLEVPGLAGGIFSFKMVFFLQINLAVCHAKARSAK